MKIIFMWIGIILLIGWDIGLMIHYFIEEWNYYMKEGDED